MDDWLLTIDYINYTNYTTILCSIVLYCCGLFVSYIDYMETTRLLYDQYLSQREVSQQGPHFNMVQRIEDYRHNVNLYNSLSIRKQDRADHRHRADNTTITSLPRSDTSISNHDSNLQ